MRMEEGEGRVLGNGRGGLKSESSWSDGASVLPSVNLETGNVYCLWLPLCFQPLTSPFVSHPLGPTPVTQALHLVWGGGW